MSLLDLEDHHFSLVLSNSGQKLLCTGIAGISLILFHTPDCEHCPDLKESFKILTQHIKGVNFGLCNVRKHKKVITISKESTTHIQYVPYVLCFINGKPFAKYDGDRSVKGIKDFIHTVHSKVENFKKTPQMQQDAIQNEGDALSNNTAVSQNRAKRCYLTMDEAYSSGSQQVRKSFGGFKTFEELYGKVIDGSGNDTRP